MPWVKGSEKPRPKWVTVNHCAKYFDYGVSTMYQLIKEPKYSEMAKRTPKGIRIDLNVAEKLIIGG